jgi:hypothetical protein
MASISSLCRDALTITVRIEYHYGQRAVYPHCEQSKLLAQLAGTRTLTNHAMQTIAALGYEFEVYQPVVSL